MTTVTELAAELGVDVRSVLTHAGHRHGEDLKQWLLYLKSLPSVAQVAEELGVSRTTVTRQFYRWCRQHGRRPEDYHFFEEVDLGRGRRAAIRVLKVPPEFREWLEHKRHLASRPTVYQLARELRLPRSYVRMKFEEWCGERGVDPFEFYYHGLRAPKEFEAWLRKVVAR